jgi:fructose-1,6-bisphosphatase II
MNQRPSRNLGLDLVRVTETAALTAVRWMGLGRPREADQAAAQAAIKALETVGIKGHAERSLAGHLMLVGDAAGDDGVPVDIIADPIDGRSLLAYGFPGALSVVVGAPSGALCCLPSASYMDKLVVSAEVAEALVPECLDAPAAWTLALIARVKNKQVGNLTVFVLDRPRHADLIREIRATGAHIMMRTEGDITGALLAASRGSSVDVLMGIGGVTEGIISACAVKAMGGAMLGRLAPQSESELRAIREDGLELGQILTCDEIVSGDIVFFAATGITDGPVLSGVSYQGNQASTNSMILRGETRTRRIVHAKHRLRS